MATFKQLKDRVGFWTVSLPTVVTNEVPAFINEALDMIQRKRNWDVMRKRLNATTTTGTRTLVARPSDWKQPRHDRPWREAASGAVTFMGWLPSEEEALKLYNLGPNDTGAPRWLRLADPTDEDETETIEVWPLPDASSDWSGGLYRVRVPYWRFLPDLAADSDDNWFTIHGSEAIEHLAAAKAFLADEDDQRAAQFEARGMAYLARLESYEKRQRLGPMRGLTARADVYGGANSGRLDSGGDERLWRPSKP